MASPNPIDASADESFQVEEHDLKKSKSFAQNFPIGFMLSGMRRLDRDLEVILPIASFIEFSVQDENAPRILTTLRQFQSKGLFENPQMRKVFLVIHGEGEIDGKRHIQFSHPVQRTRREYVRFVAGIYREVADLTSGLTTALVLHPDTLSRGINRKDQISSLAESLIDLSDLLPDLKICLESRGSKKPRVVRPEWADISFFDEKLQALGNSGRIGHCLDIAQSYIYGGTEKTITLLKQLDQGNIDLHELHLSDVKISQRGLPQVAQRLGTGLIPWNKLFEYFRCNRVLFEIFGGTRTFLDSYKHLADYSSREHEKTNQRSDFASTRAGISHSRENKARNNTESRLGNHFYYSKSKGSLFRTSPGTDRLIDLCYMENFFPRRILDLGCGNGRNALGIAQHFGCKVTLVDIDEEPLKQAHEQLEELGCVVERSMASPIEKMEQNDLEKPFDVVLMNYILQNVHPKFYNRILELVYQLTRAYCVIEVYCNPENYPEGMFTIRGNVGWYGFQLPEIQQLVGTRYEILWQGVRGKLESSSTISFLLRPLPSEETVPWDPNNSTKVKIRIAPFRRPRSPLLSGQKRTRFGRNANNRTRKPAGSFDESYLLCRRCKEPICDEDSCQKLKKWASSVLKSPEKDPDGEPLSLKKIIHQRFSSLGLEEKKGSLVYEKMNKIVEKYPRLANYSLATRIFVASRSSGVPISLAEISDAFGSDSNRMFRDVAKLKKSGLRIPVQPVNIEAYLRRFCSLLEMAPKQINGAISLLKSINSCSSRANVQGSSPTAIAAGIIRYISKDKKDSPSVKELAEVCGVTPTTIRNKFKLISSLKKRLPPQANLKQKNQSDTASLKDNFIEYVEAMNMVTSYKPVLLEGMLELSNTSRQVSSQELTDFFRKFYLRRIDQGKNAERSKAVMARVKTLDKEKIMQIMFSQPFPRFVQHGYFRTDASNEAIEWNPELWEALTPLDRAKLSNKVNELLFDYYERRVPGGY